MVLANEEAVGVIGLADTLKDDAAETIKELKRMNIEVVGMNGKIIRNHLNQEEA